MAFDTRSPSREPAAADFTKESIIRDYRIAFQSRHVSLISRKEVFTGKAKFGIFGDGKEVAQVAMARAFRKGDFRSGYYRDQTLMFALGILRIDEYFAQLYADADLERDPSSAGRQMNAHFATRLLDEDGSWKPSIDRFNSSADLSPTASQMPRLVGLAYASRLYRELKELRSDDQFSHKGDEIAWGTIGDASCAEGLFWESINAAGSLKVPMLLAIWDDGYGISVPTEFHITKGHLSLVLRGFKRSAGEQEGIDLYMVRGWDYPALCETFLNAAEIVRQEHVPAIVHVTEMTQPQGHSTSGSQERYKSVERLAWEEEYDCLHKMREWMIGRGLASTEELDHIEKEDLVLVSELQQRAWENYLRPLKEEARQVSMLIGEIAAGTTHRETVEHIGARLTHRPEPLRRDVLAAAHEVLLATREEEVPAKQKLIRWREEALETNKERYGSDLYSEGPDSVLEVQRVEPEYREDSPVLNGFEVLNRCFDAALARYPNLLAFGQDVGKLGDVNQGFLGLQEKYGELRVADTGIREATIIGQAIGMAMRGLRPIAEIQYLDYLLYCLQIMSDDLATLRWRTVGGQKAPVIIRTRGHRLEGVWHAGSLMAGVMHLLRGVYICVPRNMTQAAGFYNTLLQGDDPALVVEVLNAYRIKEKLPTNIGEFTVPLGVPEVLREGRDVTLVTYGACCRIAQEAAEQLSEVGVEVEIIDIQTLLPFDRHGRIVDSVEKTNRIVIVDEDVPGGASAFMLQQVLEKQGGYEWLDSRPVTVTSREHRPAYGSDGDYFSKPNRETIFDATYGLMHETDPRRFPKFNR